MEPDKQIVENILHGEVNQYKILVEKYQVSVFNVIYKIVSDYEEAKEITQEVFVKSFEAIHQYNPDYKFFSWIYRIAINCALQHVKSRKKSVPIEEAGINVELFQEEEMDFDKQNELINDSIGKLDEKYRSVILLKYYAKLSYSQMAEVLNLPEATVKSRLFDARKILKHSLLKIDYFTAIQYN